MSEILRVAKQTGILADAGVRLPRDIPGTISAFYEDLGNPFQDSKTGHHVKKLAPYQHRTIDLHMKHLKLLILKSQKIGLSSLCIIITLWHALTDCKGFELIVLAQSEDKAIQHGRDMRQIMLSSRFKDYMITKPSQVPQALRDQVTTVTNVFLQNPDDPAHPTQIHILPPSATQIASLKRVKFAWLSDITFVRDVATRQNLYFLALMSRLILTEGPVIIECPTIGHLGPIWEIDNRFQQMQKAGQTPEKYDFHVERIKVQEAVDAGLMREEAVEALRREHGPMFGALFEADWFAGDQAWYTQDMFKESRLATYYVEDHAP